MTFFVSATVIKLIKFEINCYRSWKVKLSVVRKVIMFRCAAVKSRRFHKLQTFNCDEETNEKINAFVVSNWDH